MKKIIITDRISQFIDFELFPETADVEMLTAYSNEEAYDIHRKKKADLIITELFGSGMNAVQFCSLIREDRDMRRVSVIICCRDNEIELGESKRCRANAVMTVPIQPSLLRHKVQELLNISLRGNCPVRFSARCARHSLRDPFDCEIENISTTGMLIEASAELNRGDRINCALVLPPAAAFEMQLEVVRTVKSKTGSDRNQYGVRFSRVDQAAQRVIEKLVEKSPGN